MRVRPLTLLACLGLALVCARASASNVPLPPCARGFDATGPTGLPAPVVLQTRCARFTVAPDGSVSASPLPPSDTSPAGAIEDLGGGAWLTLSGPPDAKQLVIVRDGQTLWRSSQRYKRARWIWGVLDQNTFAFSTYRGERADLYITALSGRERQVARNEEVVGWSSEGELYTYRSERRRDALRLRDPSGRLVGTVASGVGAFRYEPGTQALLYLRAGKLFRAQGLRSRRLADLRALGLRHASFDLLDSGLIGVSARHGAAVLEPNGSVFARFPFWVGTFVSGAGGQVVAAAGAKSIYVLRRGAALQRVYRSDLSLWGCEYMTDLAWHGNWLLIDAEGDRTVLALDTAAPGTRVELTRLAQGLPGNAEGPNGEAGLQVSWA